MTYSVTFPEMGKALASIDIGTHTARLLIARKSGKPSALRPLARKRAYIRLGEHLGETGRNIIRPDAVNRTLSVLKDFSHCTEKFDVLSVHAVATGVVREAANRDEFLARIYEHTGIRANLLTGDEEAILTGKGVLHSLGLRVSPFVVFDLGGGSTEFFLGNESAIVTKSAPLGAVVLTKRYFKSDPPDEIQANSLSGHVDQCLKEAGLRIPGRPDQFLVVGTGGTVTTLAAMLYEIPPKDIDPAGMNGLILKRPQIEKFFRELKSLSMKERMRLPGLDRERAGVILAGSLVVMRILYFFKSLQLTVSLSDLLEGILIDHLEGEENG